MTVRINGNAVSTKLTPIPNNKLTAPITNKVIQVKIENTEQEEQKQEQSEENKNKVELVSLAKDSPGINL